MSNRYSTSRNIRWSISLAGCSSAFHVLAFKLFGSYGNNYLHSPSDKIKRFKSELLGGLRPDSPPPIYLPRNVAMRIYITYEYLRGRAYSTNGGVDCI
jgi:hypothetical protein